MAKPKKAKDVYDIEFLCNGETYKAQNADIEQGILATKPVFVHTEGYITVSKGGEILAQRRLNLVQARMVFANPDFRTVFINNLLIR